MSIQEVGTDSSWSNGGIRVARAADVPAIVAVVNAAFAIETFIEGSRTDAAEVAALMRDGEFVLVEDGKGGIAACVHVETRGERGHFGMLAVDPARQGTGFGRTLVEVAEHRCRARGATRVDIMVLSLRAELLPFYHRLGYAPVGTEEFHPPRPLKDGVACHGIILSKTL